MCSIADLQVSPFSRTAHGNDCYFNKLIGVGKGIPKPPPPEIDLSSSSSPWGIRFRTGLSLREEESCLLTKMKCWLMCYARHSDF